MAEQVRRFCISSNLKNLLGRDLVTGKFEAIFELVKNSIDAMATSISIEFDLKGERILIVDNGNGMTQEDFINKWLFVGSSEKSDAKEPENIHDSGNDIGMIQALASRKGIGRFSCDTLGRELNLYSKSATDGAKVSHLHIDWSDFEQDSNVQFTDIDVKINDNARFPKLCKAKLPTVSGTVIEITGLRGVWDESSIGELRIHLAKLVDPFDFSKTVEINTYISDSNARNRHLDGQVGHNVTGLLEDSTARIHVEFSKDSIVTELYDCGVPMFKVSEENDFQSLQNCRITMNIYFLNAPSRTKFKKRMGVSAKSYGNIFLFLNGFRVIPVGEESDDTFNLGRNRKKEYDRTLCTEDVLGRVDVTAPAEMFRESSSRNSGLIEDANSSELSRAVFIKSILPLERYVTGVAWPDTEYQEINKFHGFEMDEAKLRILRIIGKLAKDPKVTFLEYDAKLVEIADAKQAKLESAFDDLLNIAERDSNKPLVKRIKKTRTRMKELEKTEKRTQPLAESKEKQGSKNKGRISFLEMEPDLLASGQNPDTGKMQSLINQIGNHAGQITELVNHSLRKAGRMHGMLLVMEDMTRDEFQELMSEQWDKANEINRFLSVIRVLSYEIPDILKFSHHEADLQVSAQSRYVEKFQLLDHQIGKHASHILAGIILSVRNTDNMLKVLKSRKSIKRDEYGSTVRDLTHQAEEIRQILSGIRLENQRIQSVLKLARFFDLNTNSRRITGNIVEFLDNFLLKVLYESDFYPRIRFSSDCSEFNCEFSPVDIAIVFENLVDNSLRADALCVRVECSYLADRNQLELLVYDDGDGMDDESMDPAQIFDQFYTGSYTRSYSGFHSGFGLEHHGDVGLGLFHVRQILEEMGGSIELRSGANETCAEFIISLSGQAK